MSNIRIRPAQESDATAFLNLWDALDSETEYMMFEPGERQMTLRKQADHLKKSSNSTHVRVMILEDLELAKIAGFAGGRRSSNFRDQHTLRVVLGIRQHYSGQGWGSKLLEQLEIWAKSQEVTRLELGVMTTNSRAIQLYKKFGFEIEGTMNNAVRLKSGYHSEHVMGKLL